MIDSHIHLHDGRFADRLDGLLQDARAVGVRGFVTPAVRAAEFASLHALAAQHADVHPAWGLHPYWVDSHRDADLSTLDEWLRQHRPCAMGECGLDHRDPSLDRERQMHFFNAQLALAKAHGLPVILHVNGAVQAVMQCLFDHDIKTAVMHSFNGSVEQFECMRERDWYFGFGCAVLHPRARKLHRLVRHIPMQRIVLETDAPDQPPHDERGEINAPANLLRVCQRVAELKNMSCAEVERISTRNCEAVFGI